MKKYWATIIWASICILAWGIIFVAVRKDWLAAKQADAQLEKQVEKYVNIDRIGLKDGYWVYIVIDKAGNETILWNDYTIPIHK